MTLQSRKKRQTTPLNIRRTNSNSARHYCSYRIGYCSSAIALFFILVASPPATAEDSSSQLQWGRLATTKLRTSTQQRKPSRQNSLRETTARVPGKVVTASLQEEKTSSIVPVVEHQNIVVERNSPIYGEVNAETSSYDPFDEDDRIAQLPDDPFDDPANQFGEDDAPFNDTDEDLEDIEAAVEREIERRRSAQDLLEDDPAEDLEFETPEVDPLDELEDEAPLADDPRDEDRMQPDDNNLDLPEFYLDEPDDPEVTPEQLRQRSEELQRESQQREENCREEIEKVEAKKISSIDLSIHVDGKAGEDFPHECSISNTAHQPRQWCAITYNWKASALCHKPLYFEQVQLERYGHSWGPYVQPIMSGVHFFSSVPLLPYKMGIRTPTECVYTLGYYRPGSCAPYLIDPIPFTWRAALFQGAVTTGIPFIVP